MHVTHVVDWCCQRPKLYRLIFKVYSKALVCETCDLLHRGNAKCLDSHQSAAIFTVRVSAAESNSSAAGTLQKHRHGLLLPFCSSRWHACPGFCAGNM